MTYYWAQNAIPETYPPTFLFDSAQQSMTEFPHSQGEFSRDESLLLLLGVEQDVQLGIVALGSGTQTWMPLPSRSGIVYE